MGRSPITVGPTGRSVAQILRNRADSLGITNEALARRTGLSEATLSRTFALRRTLTVLELNAIAEALGLDGWEVMKAAQESQSGSATVTTLRPTRTSTVDDDFDEAKYAAHTGEFDDEQ